MLCLTNKCIVGQCLGIYTEGSYFFKIIKKRTTISLKQTKKWFAFALILTAPLLTIVDVYIINMAIPAIKNQYQTVDSLTELVISAYLVGYCVFLITGSHWEYLFLQPSCGFEWV
jgi:hypothetical protein